MAKNVLLGQYNLGFNERMSKYRAMALSEALENNQPQNIIDIGSGPADIIVKMSKISNVIEKAESLVLLDMNEQYISEAKENLKKFDQGKIEYEISDLSKYINATDKKYDLIIAIDIIEHLEDPLSSLKEVKKILSKHGALYIVVPNAKSVHRLIGKDSGYIKSYYQLEAHDTEVGHQNYFDIESLSSLATKAGYKVIANQGILLKPVPNSKMNIMADIELDFLYDTGKAIPEYCAEIALKLTMHD